MSSEEQAKQFTVVLPRDLTDRINAAEIRTEFVDLFVDKVLDDVDDMTDHDFIRLSNALDVFVYNEDDIDAILGDQPVLAILEQIILDEGSAGKYECAWNYEYNPTVLVIGSEERARKTLHYKVRRALIDLIDEMFHEHIQQNGSQSIGLTYGDSEVYVLTRLYESIRTSLMRILVNSAERALELYQ